MERKRVALLGSSRGLGSCLAKTLSASNGFQILGVARKKGLLENQEVELGPWFEAFPFDLSRVDEFEALESKLAEFAPQHILYVAGGGPYGPYDQVKFSAHQWAWRVSFEGAARVCHWSLKQPHLPQVVLVGSAICEDLGDLHGASYSAAKHALKGLYLSLRVEKPTWDLRLFSPGYLDTELLPKGASVRYKKVWDPEEVSVRFIDWMLDEELLGDHHSDSAYPPNGSVI